VNGLVVQQLEQLVRYLNGNPGIFVFWGHAFELCSSSLCHSLEGHTLIWLLWKRRKKLKSELILNVKML
jgi:hypothetical protein